MDKTTALSRIGAFSALPRLLIDMLAGVSGIQRVGKGSILFREGEHAHFIYALVKGRVSLISGSDREETIADFMEAGDVILIPPALLQLPYMVTAKAFTDVLAVLIPTEDFRNLAETELALSVAVGRVLATHWRLLLRHLTQTKSRDADSRLIQYLIDGAGTHEGAADFTLPGSKRDLAAHLGMTPETLSRSLRRLGKLGVKTEGCEIHIDSIGRLSTIAQSVQDHPSQQSIGNR